MPIETAPTFEGDFFTYADKDDNYWSGYFVSRPFYKRYERTLQYHLRAAEILFSFYSILQGGGSSHNSQSLVKDLENSRFALSLFQHHGIFFSELKLSLNSLKVTLIFLHSPPKMQSLEPREHSLLPTTPSDCTPQSNPLRKSYRRCQVCFSICR